MTDEMEVDVEPLMGADWVNLSVNHDYSTAVRSFEIHLSIPLASQAEADHLDRLLTTARDKGDVDAPELKKALRKLARVTENPPRDEPAASPARSKRQIIWAIMVRPARGKGG